MSVATRLYSTELGRQIWRECFVTGIGQLSSTLPDENNNRASPLLEDPVLVAKPVADGRDLHRCEQVEEAGCEATQLAIAQVSVRFLLEQC